MMMLMMMMRELKLDSSSFPFCLDLDNSAKLLQSFSQLESHGTILEIFESNLSLSPS